MFGVQFYPTPVELIQKMLDKVDFQKIQYVLEPSAGKGNLAKGVKEKLKDQTAHIDCVEIDPDLREVLKGRGFFVAGNDFLKFSPKTRYDLVVMNPPFANGDKHLLHALDLMKNGGQIVCLLNATTVQDTRTPIRQDLMNRLYAYGAEIEIIPKAFKDAERKANVDVAIVYINIPRAEEIDITSNLRQAFDIDVPDQEGGFEALAENDIVNALIRQYEFESQLGLKLLDDYAAYQKYIPTAGAKTDTRLLNLKVVTPENLSISKHNLFLRALREKYWEALFGSKAMQQLMTRKVVEQYRNQLQQLRNYDFTAENILQIKIDLSKGLVRNLDDAIMQAFDKLTYEHSMGKNSNIHYYNGWKTNQAAAINHKVIIPFYGIYDSRFNYWSIYNARDYLTELEKILTYLDNGRTDGITCDNIINSTFSSRSRDYAGEKISCKYFDVSFKKKGTVHVWFTDEKLLKKFNIFGGKGKGWLPGDYGKKPYQAMDAEEQDIVDSFEGEKSYQETVSNAQFYFGSTALPALRA